MQSFLNFLQSKTAWHACKALTATLTGKKYQPLQESDSWNLLPGRGYFVQRGASLIAFQMPLKKLERARILGAHTDSPALKLKPNGEFQKEGLVLLNFDLYGSPLLASWVGRKLILAGRLFIEKNGEIQEELVSYEDYPFTIAPLAIHLDRKVNEEGLQVNKQEHLSAIVSDWKSLPKGKTFLQHLFQGKKVHHFELFAVIPEEPYTFGVKSELLASPRLDNLSCLYAAFEAFLHVKPKTSDLQMIAFWNHEEIGSETSEGACSSFFGDVFERIAGNRESYLRLKATSQTLSLDVAHAAHPNFIERYEPRHKPEIGSGLMLKHSAKEKYALHGKTCAEFVQLLKEKKIPLQHYMAKADAPSGSTIGPIHAARLGISTCDIGLPLFSMHASQEIIHLADYKALRDALEHWL